MSLVWWNFKGILYPPLKEIELRILWINILLLTLWGCRSTKNITYTEYPIVVTDTFTVHSPHIHIDNLYCIPPETFKFIVVDTIFIDIYK